MEIQGAREIWLYILFHSQQNWELWQLKGVKWKVVFRNPASISFFVIQEVGCE